MEDLRLRLLEKKERECIVEVCDLQRVDIEDDGMFPPGRRYLSDNHVDLPAYLKSKLLDGQELAPSKQTCFHFIAVSMKPTWKCLQQLRTDIESSSSFFALYDKQQLFNPPVITARVYSWDFKLKAHHITFLR